MSGWKPGDVAMIEVGCHANRHVGLFVDSGFLGGWRYDDNKWAANDPAIVTARPLVVIDPEDREQVERLVTLILTSQRGLLGPGADDVQAALREFANPQQEVFEHLPADNSDSGDGQLAAWCGKVWVRNPNVRVVGRCPECVEFTEKGWIA